MTNLRFWLDGARTMGTCEGRDCPGVMMVVEDMGEWTWVQCAVCLEQSGIGKSSQLGTGRPQRARDGDEYGF
jgi:hypothetical protein